MIVRRMDVSSGVEPNREHAEELTEVADTGTLEDDNVSFVGESAEGADVRLDEGLSPKL